MGRKAKAAVVQDKPVIDGEVIMGEFALKVKAEVAAKEELQALAVELAYVGDLTVSGLENEIRFYQRRSVEAVLELGKRLTLLKKASGHGFFIESLERLGFSPEMAKKFMLATRKFSNGSSTTLLELPNLNQTKLLELLVLDDGEIEALADGETVRGLKLDDVDCLSVSELRSSLRKTKREQDEEKAAQVEMTRRRDERINALEEENARLIAAPKPTPAMVEEAHLSDVSAHGQMLVREIEVGLRSKFTLLEKHFADGVTPNHVRLAQQQAISQVTQAARMLAGDFGITLTLADTEPQELLWLTQGEALFGKAVDADMVSLNQASGAKG